MTATTINQTQIFPDDAFQSEWHVFERDPGPLVFLLGCQRSGTTLLHLQLARTGTFRFLTAYDVWSAPRMVHNCRNNLTLIEQESLAEMLSAECADRGIDAIPAGPGTPEEYGLVMANARGGDIRYEQPDTTEATVPALRELCAKKALLEGRERPLLLKSPPDYSGGIACLAAAFPHARFIMIHRHPLPTLQSQVRAWREVVSRRNPYLMLLDRGYRDLFENPGRRMCMGLFLNSEAGVEWLADKVLHAHRGYLELYGSLQHRLLAIRYEDFCANQAAALRSISGFLALQLAEPAETPAPRLPGISDEVRRAFSKRLDGFAPYLSHCGYTADIA